eukprot:4915870-Pyramimonas_sp.AAC.1
MTEAALQHMSRGVHEGGTDGHGDGCATSRAEERASVQFAYEAWWDHLVALVASLLSDRDNGRVRCTCKWGVGYRKARRSVAAVQP